jgi:large subunit ribosomal protein L7/L12
MTKDTLLEWLDKASVLELHEVVKAIEEKFGVSAAAVASAGPAAGGAAEEVTEKSAYTVHLVSAGEQKIPVMKVVKEALGLSLMEAKAKVDGAPVDLKADVPKADAQKMKTDLEAAGAKVELK